MAPEVRLVSENKKLIFKLEKDNYNLEKCDLFSLGIVALQLLYNISNEECLLLNCYPGGPKLIAEKIRNIKRDNLKLTL